MKNREKLYVCLSCTKMSITNDKLFCLLFHNTLLFFIKVIEISFLKNYIKDKPYHSVAASSMLLI